MHTDRRRLIEVLRRAVAALLREQRADGHWRGELEGDSILESEYILMKFILGQEDRPMADGRPGRVVLARIANHLRSLQGPDGDLRIECAIALGDHGRAASAALPALRAVEADDDEDLRIQATLAIAKIRPELLRQEAVGS